jgi:Na+/proline symporter
MGYWVGAVGCWIDLAYSSAFQFACFYVPEGICMVVSVILVADTTRIIRQVQRQSSSLTQPEKGRTRFSYELRSVGFITLIFFNVLFLFSFKFHTFARQDGYTKAIEDEY